MQTQLSVVPVQSTPASLGTRNNEERPSAAIQESELGDAKQASTRQDAVETADTTVTALSNGTTYAEPLPMDIASESDVNSVREDEEEDWESFPLTPPRVRDPW